MSDDDVQNVRLDMMERSIEQINGSLKSINESMFTLVSLVAHHEETRKSVERAHVRANEISKKISAVDERIVTVEKFLPLAQETVTVIRRGVYGITAIVLIGIAKIAFGW